MSLPEPPVLLITDRRRTAGPLDEVVAGAFEGGCRWLSLREKDLPAEARLALTERLVRLARAYGATVTVHGDLAAARIAKGLHLSRHGDPAAARRALGPNALIGRSAHDPVEARAAVRAGVDYVTVSPVFESAGKPGYGPALGLAGLARIARDLPVPVIALGGIGPDNAAACLAAGAAGIAVIGAVMAADRPQQAAAELIAAVRKARAGLVGGARGRR